MVCIWIQWICFILLFLTIVYAITICIRIQWVCSIFTFNMVFYTIKISIYRNHFDFNGCFIRRTIWICSFNCRILVTNFLWVWCFIPSNSCSWRKFTFVSNSIMNIWHNTIKCFQIFTNWFVLIFLWNDINWNWQSVLRSIWISNQYCSILISWSSCVWSRFPNERSPRRHISFICKNTIHPNHIIMVSSYIMTNWTIV